MANQPWMKAQAGDAIAMQIPSRKYPDGWTTCVDGVFSIRAIYVGWIDLDLRGSPRRYPIGVLDEQGADGGPDHPGWVRFVNPAR